MTPCQSHTSFVNMSPVQSASLDGAGRNEVLAMFWNNTQKVLFQS